MKQMTVLTLLIAIMSFVSINANAQPARPNRGATATPAPPPPDPAPTPDPATPPAAEPAPEPPASTAPVVGTPNLWDDILDPNLKDRFTGRALSASEALALAARKSDNNDTTSLASVHHEVIHQRIERLIYFVKIGTALVFLMLVFVILNFVIGGFNMRKLRRLTPMILIGVILGYGLLGANVASAQTRTVVRITAISPNAVNQGYVTPANTVHTVTLNTTTAVDSVWFSTENGAYGTGITFQIKNPGRVRVIQGTLTVAATTPIGFYKAQVVGADGSTIDSGNVQLLVTGEDVGNYAYYAEVRYDPRFTNMQRQIADLTARLTAQQAAVTELRNAGFIKAADVDAKLKGYVEVGTMQAQVKAIMDANTEAAMAIGSRVDQLSNRIEAVSANQTATTARIGANLIDTNRRIGNVAGAVEKVARKKTGFIRKKELEPQAAKDAAAEKDAADKSVEDWQKFVAELEANKK